MLEISTVPEPEFISVTVCAALVAPVATFPNASVPGDTFNDELFKLAPLINTFESTTWSPVSAIASLMWFVTPAFTATCTESTTVNPSISVLSGAALGY
jgi:hypothetical protein